jgi:hypothetical protein
MACFDFANNAHLLSVKMTYMHENGLTKWRIFISFHRWLTC